MNTPHQAIPVASIEHWSDHADVIVVGLGIAGACAALEARRAGADVLVIERASGGGGASALSSGIFYLGGGTPVQHAAGYQDTPDAMYDFLMASGISPDAEIIRAFCNGSAEHFDWLETQGVPFERSYFPGKAVFLTDTTCLMSTGNEKVWPYREVAPPAPRGHKVAREGENAGSLAMEVLLSRCADAGLRTRYDSQVTGLIVDDDGRVVGVRLRSGGEAHDIAARRGVILATGGFNMNKDMLAEFMPHMLGNAEPLGVPYNDGAGILLGQAVGAATQSMNGVIATASFYPPSQLIKGILVNTLGERFVAEDAYHGRTAAFIMEQPGRKAYLILDSEIFAYPELTAFSHHTLVDGWETVENMEAGLGLPSGALQRTLADYNHHAAEGKDPLLHKHPDWLKPLEAGPYAAFDVSFNKSVYLYITLGGLKVNARTEVITPDGQIIPGLFAAGACASSVSRDGKDYASGLSLGPGSFFGRVAGRLAAGA